MFYPLSKSELTMKRHVFTQNTPLIISVMEPGSSDSLMHHACYITCFIVRQVRKRGWRSVILVPSPLCLQLVQILLAIMLFLTKPNYKSCLNQGLSTSVDGNPTLCTICSWCHISMWKMTVAAVERHLQGGRKTASARVVVGDVAAVCMVEVQPWIGHSSTLS